MLGWSARMVSYASMLSYVLFFNIKTNTEESSTEHDFHSLMDPCKYTAMTDHS